MYSPCISRGKFPFRLGEWYHTINFSKFFSLLNSSLLFAWFSAVQSSIEHETNRTNFLYEINTWLHISFFTCNSSIPRDSVTGLRWRRIVGQGRLPEISVSRMGLLSFWLPTHRKTCSPVEKIKRDPLMRLRNAAWVRTRFDIIFILEWIGFFLMNQW